MAGKRKFGEAEVEVSIKDRVRSGLKAIEGRLERFGAGVQSIGSKIAGVGAVAGGVFAGLGSALIFPTSLAADLEQTTVAFETMLGSGEAAGKMLADLRRFASETPLEFADITDAARKLLAFGVAAEDVEAELRRVGDIASGIGAPIGEIAEIYGKAKVQGRLFAEDINQLTGRGIPIIQELAKQFGVADSEVKKLVEDGQVNFGHLQQAFRDLTAEGAQFGGLMEKQSQTLGGMWSTAKDNVIAALIPIGQAAAEIFKPLLQSFIQLMGPIGEFIKQNAWIGRVLVVVTAAGAAAAAAVTALGIALVTVGMIVSAASTIMAALTPPVLAVAAAVAATVLGVTALGAGFVYLLQQAGLLGGILEWLKTTFGTLLQTVKMTFGGIMDAMAAGQYMLAAQILWAGLKLAFLQGAGQVLKAFGWLWDNAWDISQKFFGALIRSVFRVFKSIPGLIKKVLTGSASIGQAIAQAIGGGVDFSAGLDAPIAAARNELQQLNARAARARNLSRGAAAQGGQIRAAGAAASAIGQPGTRVNMGGVENNTAETNQILRRMLRRPQPGFQ